MRRQASGQLQGFDFRHGSEFTVFWPMKTAEVLTKLVDPTGASHASLTLDAVARVRFGWEWASVENVLREEMKEETEVKLRCGVYGEGTVFPVKIARDAEVSALQKAIFDDQLYRERFSFPSSALTLYLAGTKEGEATKWLADDDNLDTLLRGNVDKQYAKMRTSWILDEDCFGKKFQPGRKEVHVLVELPPLQVADPRLLQLQESLLHHVLLDAPSSTSKQLVQAESVHNVQLRHGKWHAALHVA